MAQTEWGGEVGSLRIKLVKTHKVFFKNLHYLTKQNKKVIKKMVGISKKHIFITIHFIYDFILYYQNFFVY